jgi:cytoskeletal protein RodZ
MNFNLEDVRRAKGITLEDIYESTRIGLPFLEAIESEDLAKLPGGVYNASYLKQYARAIGFDEATLLGWYYGQVQPQPAPEAPTSRWQRAHESLRDCFGHFAARHRKHA